MGIDIQSKQNIGIAWIKSSILRDTDIKMGEVHSPRHNESPLQQYTSTKLETPPVSINTREINCGILILRPLDENRQASAPCSNMNRSTIMGKKDKLVGHTCNLNTWEIEAGELDSKLNLVPQWVQGHPELYESLSLKVKLNLKDKGEGRWGKRTDTKEYTPLYDFTLYTVFNWQDSSTTFSNAFLANVDESQAGD